jgi:arylsulfatase A-like enzyme
MDEFALLNRALDSAEVAALNQLQPRNTMTPMKPTLLCALCILCAPSHADDRPNIIVFYTDDHGHADLGAQGAVKDIKTPNVDALAASGARVLHGYSTAPQCVPSRAGLMTGKFQARFGVEDNGSSLEGFNRETTIARRLQDAGYITAQFGKWHLGPTDEIPRHGFKHVFAQNGSRPFSANIGLDGNDRPMSDLPNELYHIDGCSRAAASLIERYKDSPFFLYIAYRAPHVPLDAPKAYLDRFPGPMPERRRQALAMLSAVDDGVGLVMETLKKHHLSDKTLIFFIGDNGAPLKIHKADTPLRLNGWDGSLNDPLNGEKGMLAEGGMHVPFVIAWPGTIPGGQTYPHPVSSLDVAATASALAGVSINPGDLDGVNLVPHLKGEIKTAPHEALMWRWSAQSAIREGKWKLLRGGDREYLYDLDADLGEKHNLTAQHPDIAKRLRDRLQAWTMELQPPGLANGNMAPAWNEYFDYYLEGKPAPLLREKFVDGEEDPPKPPARSRRKSK